MNFIASSELSTLRTAKFKLHLIASLVATIVANGYPKDCHAEEIQQTTRLSAWLIERLSQSNETPYLPALVWTIPEEKIAQTHAKASLMMQMHQMSSASATRQLSNTGLMHFAESLPVTGRVVLDKSDPRWLQVNPDKDPLLQKGHQIVLQSKPGIVTLVFGDGKLCQVNHNVRLFARDYIRQCSYNIQATQVWIVQPDGVVQRRGIATWNEEQQAPPAPGAWLLVEEARFGWQSAIYEQVARLLATQGPATFSESLAEIRQAPVKKHNMLAELTRSGVPIDLKVNSSDWGSTGLMQTPTARMAGAGAGSINLSHTNPYTRLNFTLQPLDWLETSFRYIDVSNRLYGPVEFSGNQSYKDKSIDAKLRLKKETALWPEIAVGVRDIGGTGLFAGEYLVANKRTGNFDWSLGIGWGYLGGRADLTNPLSFLGESLKTRSIGIIETGKLNLDTLFHGPVAMFAGVQYQTPIEKLMLKLEYDGNDYQHEPQNNNQPQKSPFNLGVVWRQSDNLDLTAGIERGNTLMLGATFHGLLDRLAIPKINDPKQIPVSQNYPVKDPTWSDTRIALEEATGWQIQQLLRAGSEIIVRFKEVKAFQWNSKIDRIAAILHRDATEKTLVFRVQLADTNLKLSEFLIDRHTWVEAQTRYLSPHEAHPSIAIADYTNGFLNPNNETLLDVPNKPFKGDYGVYLHQSLGGPSGFARYQIGGKLSAKWQPNPNTWLSGITHLRLIDNYDDFKFTSSGSTLPRVRTYIGEYMTTSKVLLPNLQMTHVGQLNSNHFFSLYGGLLESMYAGLGAEWLYRPFNSHYAFGLDINQVQQRDFKQNFSLRDYKTMTGHASLYWDTGIQDIHATVQAGKYLGGDVGVSIDLSRAFDNGIKMGAWLTKTNVSAEDFGEGSFDKGIYLSIPFDTMMTRSSASVGSLVWQPLTRDGGARLHRAVKLDDLTRSRKGDSLRWKPFSNLRINQFGDVADYDGMPKQEISYVDAAMEDLTVLKTGLGKAEFWQSAAWVSGITLGSSLLDKTADNFAKSHGESDVLKGVKALGNNLPFLALGFSGFMALRDTDQRMSNANFASLEAGGIGVLTALGLKYVLGRSRPEENQGPTQFNALSRKNSDSSLPSVHSTAAWAALTPYAKAYDAPWLYGLAALTNVARIGDRKHWLSDTVGGAFIGYGLGSLIWENRRNSKHSPSIYLMPGEVGLKWATP